MNNAQALGAVRAIGKMCKTREAELKKELLEDDSGANRWAVDYGAGKVGTVYVAERKAGVHIECTDRQAFEDFMVENGLGSHKMVFEPAPSWETMTAATPDGTLVLTATGEPVPGMRAVYGEPARYVGVRGCDPEDVISSMRESGLLDGGAAALLTGGGNG